VSRFSTANGAPSQASLPNSRFRVVALAGGVLEADFRRAGYSVPNKAYLPVAGELMIVRVLRALRGAAMVSEIRLVTSPEALATASGVSQFCDVTISPGNDLIGSVVAGVDGVPNNERVLMCATDIPLLSTPAVDAFARLVEATQCDAGYGFVERESHDRLYPSIRHTWVKLHEGTFCGGGLSVLRVAAVKQMESVLRLFTDARKSPIKMASLLSPGLVLKLMGGQVRVEELERRASTLTGLVCRGILCPSPEVAVNVDRIEDLRAVEKSIAASAQADLGAR
jgi:GTP:adenosylcobinamide-phosphate guanylyltransferase